MTGAVPQQSSISDAGEHNIFPPPPVVVNMIIDTSSKKEKKKRKLQEQESDANAGEDAAGQSKQAISPA